MSAQCLAYSIKHTINVSYSYLRTTYGYFRYLFLKDKDQLIGKKIKLTCFIGVDMLLQYINSAQTNHEAPAKPERDHRPKPLV